MSGGLGGSTPPASSWGRAATCIFRMFVPLLSSWGGGGPQHWLRGCGGPQCGSQGSALASTEGEVKLLISWGAARRPSWPWGSQESCVAETPVPLGSCVGWSRDIPGSQVHPVVQALPTGPSRIQALQAGAIWNHHGASGTRTRAGSGGGGRETAARREGGWAAAHSEADQVSAEAAEAVTSGSTCTLPGFSSYPAHGTGSLRAPQHPGFWR